MTSILSLPVEIRCFILSRLDRVSWSRARLSNKETFGEVESERVVWTRLYKGCSLRLLLRRRIPLAHVQFAMFRLRRFPGEPEYALMEAARYNRHDYIEWSFGHFSYTDEVKQRAIAEALSRGHVMCAIILAESKFATTKAIHLRFEKVPKWHVYNFLVEDGAMSREGQAGIVRLAASRGRLDVVSANATAQNAQQLLLYACRVECSLHIIAYLLRNFGADEGCLDLDEAANTAAAWHNCKVIQYLHKHVWRHSGKSLVKLFYRLREIGFRTTDVNDATRLRRFHDYMTCLIALYEEQPLTPDRVMEVWENSASWGFGDIASSMITLRHAIPLYAVCKDFSRYCHLHLVKLFFLRGIFDRIARVQRLELFQRMVFNCFNYSYMPKEPTDDYIRFVEQVCIPSCGIRIQPPRNAKRPRKYRH